MARRQDAGQSGGERKLTTLMLAGLVVAIIVGVWLLNTCKAPKAVLVENREGNVVTTGSSNKMAPVQVGMQLPASRAGEAIIQHKAYTLSFNPDHEQANWVAYALRGSQLASAHHSRTDKFMTDPLAKPHSADNEDYEGSGYDRGHLASAEDMSWSATSMKESFYYTNMSPQEPSFNRGVWRRLEELVRFWSTAYDSIYVVTGPVLKKGLRTIGHNKVSVPKYFYKVVLEYNPKGTRAIGFVMKNEASPAILKSFAVSIDSVEKLTGIDFFPKLPDDVEAQLERKANIGDWYWKKSDAE